jgi:iron(III) transport system substrate-binding protein
MWRRLLTAVLPLAAIVAIPLLLRPSREGQTAADDTVIIVTPHNEAIRFEFGRGFREAYRERFGREVRVDWRTPGGTSQITRHLDDRFHAAFRRWWVSDPERGPWTATVAAAFNDRRLDPADPRADPEAARARRAFLDSDVGIGIDLFFGGGQYEMQAQARKGHAVDAGLQARHPEWFDESVIPASYSGETFYDPGGRYYGTCLSAFGICYNHDRLAALPDPRPPRSWLSLGEPRFFGQIAVADPTKSGSITKCFEMLIQERMAAAVTAAPQDASALVRGWADGLNLIKRIGGNCRYITDSASKVPRDVGTGEIAAGLCIDFYGRTQAEWTGFQSGGVERVSYLTPPGGSSLSVDPIQLFRGAPNREPALAFMEFILGEAGQKLWNYRVGAPGGPRRYALRRLPVRRDLYTSEHRRWMSDADADPYAQVGKFEYRTEWTAPYFNLIRVLIRCMILDPLPELQQAWGGIVAAGGPEQAPEAMAYLVALPFDYAGCAAARRRLDPSLEGQSPLTVLQTTREWTEFFRTHYRQAAALAAKRHSGGS